MILTYQSIDHIDKVGDILKRCHFKLMHGDYSCISSWYYFGLMVKDNSYVSVHNPKLHCSAYNLHIRYSINLAFNYQWEAVSFLSIPNRSNHNLVILQCKEQEL